MNKANKKRENTKTKDSKNVESNPKEQRNRKPKLTTSTSVEKVSNNETVEVDFTNLKKETDEIKKLTESSKFSKRQISSNWEKYEKRDEEEYTTAADFSSLLQAPVSSGGHFQFKFEKDWDVKIKSNYSEYFSLNLKTINDSILSIPFYERHDIDFASLNPSQVVHMNNDAIRFQNKLNAYEKKKGKSSQNLMENKNNEEIVSGETIESNESLTNNDEIIIEMPEKIVEKVIILTDVDDLLELRSDGSKSSFKEEILPSDENDVFEGNIIKNDSNTTLEDNLVEEDIPVTKEPKTTSNTTMDLEQWLDDILDD